jgi:hypothetical protein
MLGLTDGITSTNNQKVVVDFFLKETNHQPLQKC